MENKCKHANAGTAEAKPPTGATASVVEPAWPSSDLKSINAIVDKMEALSSILLLQEQAINGKIAQFSDTDAAKDVLRFALQRWWCQDGR